MLPAEDLVGPISIFSLKRMTNRGDLLADAVALRIDRRRPPQMMDEIHYLAKTEIGVYQEYIDHLFCPPAWIDWEEVEHARHIQSAFNHARSLAILAGSVLEGFCQNRAALTLARRGHLNQEVVRRAHDVNHIIQSITHKDTLKPGNPGHRTLSEIRISNAMVRKALLNRQWKEQNNSMPMSQLDMAFDMMQFSHIAMRGLEHLGITLSNDDKAAIHHYWRVCAYLYGVDENLLTDSLNEEADLYTQLSNRNRSICDEHKQLAQTTLRYVSQQILPNLPLDLLTAISHLCIGDSLANSLDISSSSTWKRSINFYITANKGAVFAYYRIPGMSGLNERFSQLVARNLLNAPEERKRIAANIA